MSARRADAEASGGFTLIEVMIAIAILSMALAAVFGSNIGAARQTAHARALTRATLMGRCRLTEAHAWLVKNQLPTLDQALEDPPATGGQEACCTDGVTCDVQVDTIELPSPSEVDESAGDQLLGRAASAARGTSFSRDGGTGITTSGSAGGSNPVGALAGAMSMMGGSAPGGGSSAGGSGGSLSGAGAPSPREMASTLLGAIYPTIKPLLEGAIRRLTMTVRWREGDREMSFQVIEYVTNPGQTLGSGDANLPGGGSPPPGAAGGAGGPGGVSGGPPTGAPPGGPLLGMPPGMPGMPGRPPGLGLGGP